MTPKRPPLRSFVLAPAALVAALVASLVVAAAQPRDVLPAQRSPADRTPASDESYDRPAAPLRVHEWGVWRLRQGQIDHLAELARENPRFVHRTNRAARLPVTPRRIEEPVIADKPVVYLYAGTEMDVELTVEFANGGEPWFYYPAATTGVTEPPARRTVRWQGHVTLPGAAQTGPPLVSAPPGHFWNALRAVGASTFRPTGAAESERFLFYDGPTPFPRVLALVASGSGLRVQRTMRDAEGQQVWVVDAGGFVRADVSPTAQRAAANRGSIQELERQLRAALVARGLSDAEATSLCDTWRGDLFRRTERRAIWFLPRAAYDAMLPITVRPDPLEIVRVGLVIQML